MMSHPLVLTYDREAVPLGEVLDRQVALLRERQATLSDLLDATERRYRKLARPAPPAFLLYIDQGEELYVRVADKQERRRFSEIVAGGLAEPRAQILEPRRGTESILRTADQDNVARRRNRAGAHHLQRCGDQHQRFQGASLRRGAPCGRRAE